DLKRAGSRPRQQCRPSPQGAEEEDAARGHLPRDEASRTLRKTLRKEGPREGGSDPPGAQACPQAHAARGAVADEAAAGPGRTRRPARSAPPALLIDPLGSRAISAARTAPVRVVCFPYSRCQIARRVAGE